MGNKFTVVDLKIDVIKNSLSVKADADVLKVDNYRIIVQLCSPFPTDRYSWRCVSAPPNWYEINIRDKIEKCQ